MTKKEILVRLEELNVPTDSKMKKAELEQLLLASETPVEAPEPVVEDVEPEAEVKAPDELSEAYLTEVQTLCRVSLQRSKMKTPIGFLRYLISNERAWLKNEDLGVFRVRLLQLQRVKNIRNQPALQLASINLAIALLEGDTYDIRKQHDLLVQEVS